MKKFLNSKDDLDKVYLLHYSGYMKRLKPWDEKTKNSDLMAYKIWWIYYHMYNIEMVNKYSIKNILSSIAI